jgi:hypothetical protein
VTRGQSEADEERAQRGHVQEWLGHSTTNMTMRYSDLALGGPGQVTI